MKNLPPTERSPESSPAAPSDHDNAEAHRWNLKDIYPNEDAFRAHLEAVQKQIESIGSYKGRLHSNPTVLADALEVLFDLSKQFYKLHGYASMLSDEDTNVAKYQAMKQEVEMLWTEFARASSWIRPELITMDQALLEWPALEPRLLPFDQYLRDLKRSAAHVLSPQEERILAEAGLVTGGAGSLYALFQNAELPRPTVKLSTGEEVHLSSAEFAKHRTSSNREDRKLLFESYYSAYRAFRGTLGLNLNQAVKSHVFRARARHHESALAASLHGENIPLEVYHNLINQVHQALPTLHRYFKLRARALQIPKLKYYDLHNPLVEHNAETIDVETSKAMVIESMAPLGEAYTTPLRTALEQRWIDWHPRKGKRSGAYSTGAAYDVHPYILLNYNGDFESVSTLTHELGHSMHSFFSNQRQPFAKSHYSIFNAEVASTFNEALLLQYKLDRANSNHEKIELITHALDGWRGTLFRQTQFAEFELEIHTRVESGAPLTGESLDELYLSMLRKYFGHHEGVAEIDEEYAIEWAGIPHFYYDYYVYQYATGIVAATALSQAVLQKEGGAVDRYIEFLHAGGSRDSLDILRSAGVDLTQAEPFQATFDRMESMLDQLEQLLNDENA